MLLVRPNYENSNTCNVFSKQSQNYMFDFNVYDTPDSICIESPHPEILSARSSLDSGYDEASADTVRYVGQADLFPADMSRSSCGDTVDYVRR